ncbi:MAG: diadenylate cyclase [Chitinivibrionales bacterium]|nr:diadenylate cyclase [Chitinivibrionales bacterium]
MAFYQYLTLTTVVDIKSTDKGDALKELALIHCKALSIRKQKSILEDIMKREETASTFIGQGVAIPYTVAPIIDDFAIIVGRSVAGINYDAARGAQAHIIALVMAKNIEDSRHIELRAEIASFFKSDTIREKILDTQESLDIMDIGSFDGKKTKSISELKKRSAAKKKMHPIILAAVALAHDVKASSIVFLADAVETNDFLDCIRTRIKVIVVTSNKARFEAGDTRFTDVIQAPYYPESRTGQIKIGVILAISRNLLSKVDRVVSVSGNSNIGTFDTIVVLDLEKEFQFFFTATRAILPPDVKPEVLERVLGLASEISIEGREGKPTGTIFVLGDTNTVNLFVRQLIINPFRGYSEAERNILDPALDETIKEFASIDGAFIVTGDGIVLSAGSYLRPSGNEIDIVELPSGFGARHAAAAGITICSNALAITVSESTGMVSVFKNGNIMLTLSKPLTRAKGVMRAELEIQ